MDYLSVEEARARKGLRLVLTFGGPGPWSEAAKGFFWVKKLEFAPVLQEGGGENRALLEWTGQTLAPVAIFDDEPPLSGFSDILWLAERLAPEPRLIPKDLRQRVSMFGLLREITGQHGLAWSKRLVMLAGNLERQSPGPARDFTESFAKKFRFTADAVEPARRRVIEILEFLVLRLREQRESGRRFFVGDQLSGVDIAWAAFAAMFDPLPEDLCPMPRGLRRMYTEKDPQVLAALDPILIEHRDTIYRDFLALPLDF